MARMGSDVHAVLITSSSATGAYHDISAYVTEISGLTIEALLQEGTAFSDAWPRQFYTGIRQAADITITGFYDDVAASGPHALFGGLTQLGSERVMKLKFGTTNEYPKFDCLIKSYMRDATRRELTKYTLVVTPTGAVTNATT